MALPRQRRAPKKRRTVEQIFMDKLTELSNGGQTLIMNSILRDALDWDEQKYKSTHYKLKRDGQIIVGTGHGGKVGLYKPSNVKALKLFISYSHVDEQFKSDFVKHIDPLKRLNLIESWHDGKISAGKDINRSVLDELSSADIVVLMVSIDYLNSYYCVEIEMEKAMERHREGSARVIPIILRSCMWQHMPFSSLKALPQDAKAISTWADRDESLASIAEGIRVVADELMGSR